MALNPRSRRPKRPIQPMTAEVLATLPEVAFIDNRHDRSEGAAPVIAVRREVCGYHPVFTQRTAQELNEAAGVTTAQAQAMHSGSMFGWDAPAANPANWEGLVSSGEHEPSASTS